MTFDELASLHVLLPVAVPIPYVSSSSTRDHIDDRNTDPTTDSVQHRATLKPNVKFPCRQPTSRHAVLLCTRLSMKWNTHACVAFLCFCYRSPSVVYLKRGSVLRSTEVSHISVDASCSASATGNGCSGMSPVGLHFRAGVSSSTWPARQASSCHYEDRLVSILFHKSCKRLAPSSQSIGWKHLEHEWIFVPTARPSNHVPTVL